MHLFPFRMICTHRQNVNKLCLINPQTQASTQSASVPSDYILACADIQSVPLQRIMGGKDVCTTGILFAGARELEHMALRRIYLPIEDEKISR